MNSILIARHNEVVGPEDIVIHAGDFTMRYKNSYSERLNGMHIYLKGSHDYWMDREIRFNSDASNCSEIWEQEIEGQHIVVCHYAMRVWSKSHYNSWQLFGHSHGKLEGIGKQMDIGVDTNNFYPYSFADIKKIMSKKEDNFNLIK